MTWVVDGCPALGEFDTEGEAIAAAWSQTMPGGKRPGIRERVNDEWRGAEIAGVWADEITVAPVVGRSASTGHGARTVLSTTFTAPRRMAELVAVSMDADEIRKSWFSWVVRHVEPVLYADNPFEMRPGEDLSIGVESMDFDGEVFVAKVEAVIINVPAVAVEAGREGKVLVWDGGEATWVESP